MTVTSAQRFAKTRPCPICGGWDDLARGKGMRCSGFLSTDGLYAHCSREEHAGKLLQEATGTYVHRLAGQCNCGAQHGPERPAAKGTTRWIVATYDYTDEAGTLPYQVVRYEPKAFKQRRPDGKGGWVWNLAGVRHVPYRLPELLAAPNDADIYIAEGEKDVDRIRSLGLFATCNAGGAGKWRAEYSSWLSGRRVVILPDNDEAGRKHAEAVATALQGIAASVKVLALPGLPERGDVSDWLDAGGTRAEMERLVSDTPEWTQPTAPATGSPPAGATRPDDARYVVHDGAICIVERDRKGNVAFEPMCNFNATISEELISDDGVSEHGELAITGTLANGHPLGATKVALTQFSSMNWILPAWGSRAIMFAGQATRDRLRDAIQRLSGDVTRRRVYTHLGWREIDGQWRFLHAGGAIGPSNSSPGPIPDAKIGPGGPNIEGNSACSTRVNGPIDPIGPQNIYTTPPGIHVEPPGGLDAYTLPEPTTGGSLRGAIRASLRMLDVAPDSVTVPVYAAIWTAPIGGADFSVHLEGRSGKGKTVLATLAQAHWGLPLGRKQRAIVEWKSTANFLEMVAFHAKDCLLLIDDYKPAGPPTERARWEAKLDQVIRGQANGTGRGRLSSDSSMRPVRPPRGLVLSTGEDVTTGESLYGRLFHVEAEPLSWPLVTECQRDAGAGLYATALAGYLRWLADHYETVQAALADAIAQLRDRVPNGGHQRNPSTVARLFIGLRCFARYAIDAGGITQSEASALLARGWDALVATSKRQAERQTTLDPARRFLALVDSALRSGRAHLLDQTGKMPEANAARYGWVQNENRREIDPTRASDTSVDFWKPGGRHIGWTDGTNVWLEPESAYALVQLSARDQGDSIALQAKSLWKRLDEDGLLSSTSHGHNTTRVTLAGQRVRVLHLTSDILEGGVCNLSGQSGQSGQDSLPPSSSSAENAENPWPDFLESPPEQGQSGQGSHENGAVPHSDPLDAADVAWNLGKARIDRTRLQELLDIGVSMKEARERARTDYVEPAKEPVEEGTL
ncbi:MAG: DUF927 domain-containing protein [Chloroflexota bacterium]